MDGSNVMRAIIIIIIIISIHSTPSRALCIPRDKVREPITQQVFIMSAALSMNSDLLAYGGDFVWISAPGWNCYKVQGDSTSVGAKRR